MKIPQNRPLALGPYINDVSKILGILDPLPPLSVPNSHNLPSFGQNLANPLPPPRSRRHMYMPPNLAGRTAGKASLRVTHQFEFDSIGTNPLRGAPPPPPPTSHSQASSKVNMGAKQRRAEQRERALGWQTPIVFSLRKWPHYLRVWQREAKDRERGSLKEMGC